MHRRPARPRLPHPHAPQPPPPSPARPVRSRARFAPIVLIACALTTAANAQQDRQRRAERVVQDAESRTPDNTADPLNTRPAYGTPYERALIDAGGHFSFTALTLDDEIANSTRLLQYDTALFTRVNLDDTHLAFFRARLLYRDFSPGDSFNGRGDQWVEPYLDRYWYEINLGHAIHGVHNHPTDTNLTINLGRQFYDHAAGLVFSDILYAVRPTLTIGNHLAIQGILGVTADESVVDFDASRDEFDRSTSRGLFGATLRYTTPAGRSFYLFALNSPDYNDDNTPRFAVDPPVDFGYDATYLGIGAEGSLNNSFTYLAEFVYQVGTSMSDPLRGPQTQQDIRAWAARAQLTYLLRDPNQSQLQAELLIASADDDRITSTDTIGGNLAGTDDNAFNSLGYANTGLAFASSLSNLVSLRLGMSTFPLNHHPAFDRLQVGADLLLFSKLDADAPIDEPTTTDAYLGLEPDLYLNYRITSDLALNLRYGVFFPGEGIAGPQKPRHFVSFSFTISF